MIRREDFDFVTEAVEQWLDWRALLNAFLEGHRKPKAELADTFLYRGKDTLLSRAAWINGLGSLVKTATVFPNNQSQGLANVNGAVSLFSDDDGRLRAMLDFHLVTKWKTAGDSLLAASLLARPNSKAITLVGAGTVVRSMYSAYSALFPDAEFTIWNRTPEKADDIARNLPNMSAIQDLRAAVEQADIICCATMSQSPVIRGAWLQAGQHLDLIGAYRPDMREVDDEALQRACLFVDNKDTVLGHIGEFKIPLEQNKITTDDVIADFYDIEAGLFRRKADRSITIAKNGGGAHLDLMTSSYIYSTWQKNVCNNI